jgi:hypothetical protein
MDLPKNVGKKKQNITRKKRKTLGDFEITNIDEPKIQPPAPKEINSNSNFVLNPNVSTIVQNQYQNPIEQKVIPDYPIIPPQLDSLSQQCRETNNPYSKECNQFLFEKEKLERAQSLEDENNFLYPTLNDIEFNVKIAEKKEFQETKYNGKLHDIVDDILVNQQNFEKYTQELIDAEFELAPHQNFVRNYLSFQTPYNSLLLFHGLGSGKTLTAIGIAEEMRDYLKKMGISKKIIIVASPNVQDNFKLQLFDERRLNESSPWIMNDVVGNKILKEVNPLNSNLSREELLKQVNKLINSYYSFFGYIQFANYINHFTHTDDNKQTVKNLQNEFNNSLIIIDEIQNMKNINESKNGKIASKAFQKLIKAAQNLRLLFLTATPMFNSCEEIIWILNMMNMNDKRSIMKISDVFDKDENLKEEGRELLIQKATGYVSFVRGENPYTFPFRIYPKYFAPNHTFNENLPMPIMQMNGKMIESSEDKILGLYLTELGNYQSLVYKYLIKLLFDEQLFRNKVDFKDFTTFNYTILQPLIQSLIITYPTPGNQIPDVSLDEYYLMSEPSTESSTESSTVSSSEPTESSTESSTEPSDLTTESSSEQTESSTESLPQEEKEQEEEQEQEEKEEKQQQEESLPQVEESLPENSSEEQKQQEQQQEEEQEEEEQQEEKQQEEEQQEEQQEEKQEEEEQQEEKQQEEEQEEQQQEEEQEEEEQPQQEQEEEQEEEEQQEEQQQEEEKQEEPQEQTEEESLPQVEESLPENSSEEEQTESLPENSSEEEQQGGMEQEEEEEEQEEETPENMDISDKNLIGTNGLKNIMNYTDTATKKGNFKYKYTDPQYHIFKPQIIGNYSSKIKDICENIYNSSQNIVSQGIILIYSQYIDSGLIPMALALEEMGFKRFNGASLFDSSYKISSVDSSTFEKIDGRNKRSQPACYSMITGDKKLSPNNKEELKNITNERNKEGHFIKVILISQAGSEGIDFKFIRQVHILDPWYNINRIEQIIGRAVRNFSHKSLPLEQRNVQIFLHGTILPFNKSIEAADLYIYRIAEYKAKQIGMVTRLLKETAVDCILNHNQTNFDIENMRTELVIRLSTLPNQPFRFQVGDEAYTSTCDYMETCQYQCNPSLKEEKINDQTYSEAFIKMNIDKVMNKIRFLFKKKYFYDKESLIKEINNVKIYSQEQINYALTELINEPTEILIDKHGKKGHLVNIGNYYLFQPFDLNNPNISLLNREIPIDDKEQKINIHVDKEYNEYDVKDVQVLDIEKERIVEKDKYEKITVKTSLINQIKNYYDLAIEFFNIDDLEKRETFSDGDPEWKHKYSTIGIVMKNLNNNGLLFNERNGIKEDILKQILIENIIDFLLPEEKILLFQIILKINPSLSKTDEFYALLQYACIQKFIDLGDKYAYVLYVENDTFYYITNKENIQWEITEKNSLIKNINEIVNEKISYNNFNKYVGFVDLKTSIMVFKTKNTFPEGKRIQHGSICDQAGKVNQIKLLNNIIGKEIYSQFIPLKKKLRSFFYSLEIQNEKVNTKYINKYELCILCEFILRYFQMQQKEEKTWFLDYETQKLLKFNRWVPI